MCVVAAEPGTCAKAMTVSSALPPDLGRGSFCPCGVFTSAGSWRGLPGAHPPSPTGVIRTAVPDLDRESQERYEVVIQAMDMAGQLGGLSGSTTVTIVVTDVNDNPPRFPQSE